MPMHNFSLLLADPSLVLGGIQVEVEDKKKRKRSSSMGWLFSDRRHCVLGHYARPKGSQLKRAFNLCYRLQLFKHSSTIVIWFSEPGSITTIVTCLIWVTCRKVMRHSFFFSGSFFFIAFFIRRWIMISISITRSHHLISTWLAMISKFAALSAILMRFDSLSLPRKTKTTLPMHLAPALNHRLIIETA